MYIAIDGKIERIEENRIYISEAFNFGFSLFETILVRDGRLIIFDRHIERLNRSLELLGIKHRFDSANLKADAEKVIEINNFKNGALKILASKAGEEIKTVITLRDADYSDELYQRGYKLKFSKVRRNQDSILHRIKSANFLENILEKNRAADEGYDDALFLNVDSYLAETSVSNLFFVKDGKLYTPSDDCGLLKGTVRDLILEIAESEQIETEEGKYRVNDLENADEVFVTNSLMGVMPVYSIEFGDYSRSNEQSISEYELSLSEDGVTALLSKSYEKYISEEI